MEDIFQIVIIVFFILSSIASARKKKRKKEQAKNRQNVQTTVQVPVQKKKQKSSAEILEEILGLKVDIPEPPKREAPAIKHKNEEVDTWDPSSEYDLESEDGVSNYQEKISEKKSQLFEAKKKHEAFKNKEVEPQKEEIKKISNSTVTKKLFTGQNNLKDYIIIQEILNKPKALRR